MSIALSAGTCCRGVVLSPATVPRDVVIEARLALGAFLLLAVPREALPFKIGHVQQSLTNASRRHARPPLRAVRRGQVEQIRRPTAR